MTTTPVFALQAPPERLAAVDAARGLAVLAMIGYHFAWDLWFFGLLDADLLGDPWWLGARTAIVSSFLFIAGVCAMAPGAQAAAGLARRFVRLAAAAAAVSAATWVAFPDSWVFFGVLHHMAVAGLLAAALRPVAGPALLAALALAALGLGLSQSFTALDEPWLRWIGMGATEPESNDYVPLFPWFGVVLAGMAVGPALLRAAGRASAPSGGAGRFLMLLGRYSLIIYLAHQPILYGGVWAYVEATTPRQAADGTRAERDFIGSCVATCQSSGGQAAGCETACLCARDSLRRADLWAPLLTNALTLAQAEAAEKLLLACAPGGDAPGSR